MSEDTGEHTRKVLEEIKPVCTKCALHKYATKVVNSVYPTDKPIEIAFIAEAPGEMEDEKGLPLIGPAGQNLNSALSKAGIKREDVFVGNICRCRPPNNRAPTQIEISKCYPYLLKELREVKPKVVVCLGLTASKAILKDKNLKMGEAHGRSYNGKSVLGFDCIIIPTWHPSPKTLEYNPARMDQLISDLLLAKTMIGKGEILAENKDWSTIIVDNYVTWKETFELLDKEDNLIFDLETTGLEFLAKDARITNIGLSTNSTYGVSVIGKEEGNWTEDEFSLFLKDLKYLMDTKNIIAHYMSFDAKYMKKVFGIWPKNWYWDTALGHALIRPGESCKLKDISWKYTNMGGYEHELSMYGGLLKANAYERAGYNISDVVCTSRIFEKQFNTIQKENRIFLTSQVVFPAAEIMSEMEYTGVAIDEFKLQELKRIYESKSKELKNRMYTNGTIMAYNKQRQAFNPNSSKQLATLLFHKDYCAYPVERRTATEQPSTDKYTLKELKRKYNSEICEMVLDYHAISKLYGTYIKGMQERLINGRIHTTYRMDSTVSGRLSSENPNLQTLPKESDIKTIFVPDPGYRFVYLDYRQMELIISTYYSRDSVMIAAIKSGDAHEYLAKIFFGSTNITEENRRRIKTINFGVLYGMGPTKLAESLEIDEEEAKNLITEYFNILKDTKVYVDKMRRQAEEKGFAISRFGRIRRYKKKDELLDGEKAEYNSAVNHPIQSLASDLMLYAMVQWKKHLVRQNLYPEKVYMTLQVHDSVTSCVEESLVEKIIVEKKQVFEATKFNFMTLPLTVEIRTGYNWGNLTKVQI